MEEFLGRWGLSDLSGVVNMDALVIATCILMLKFLSYTVLIAVLSTQSQ
jgi:hypothetical protein